MPTEPREASAANRFEALLMRPWPGDAGLAARFAAASRRARGAVAAATPREAALRDVTAGVAAPMLVSYALWVLLDARARGLERLYFLSRDGQVLLALAGPLAARLGLGIECRYLYASRQAWIRNLADLSGPGGQDWLWYGCRPGETRLGDILRRLGSLGQGEELAAGLGAQGVAADAPDRVLDAADMQRLRRALAGVDLGRARAENRRLLLAYLGQEGVLEGRPAGVVDLGWIGSLHAALADLLAEEGRAAPHGYLFGAEPGGAARWRPFRHAYLFDLDRAPERLFLPVLDLRAYLEVFCAADHGTLAGYREAAGRVAPELVPGWAEAAEAWGLGVTRATHAAVLEAFDPGPVSREALAAMRAPVAALLESFWTRPTPAEARAWGGFPLDLGEGHGSRPTRLAEPYGAGDLGRLLARRARLRKRDHFWVEGALAMSPPPVRAALGTLRRMRSGLAGALRASGG